MNPTKATKMRWAGILVLSVVAMISLFESVREITPYWNFVVAIGAIVSWMLGQRYEREVIVEAELADREDILQAVRDADRWIF